mmetsp:Transcript_101463/g.286222  ORF Transcript_101463/g.286222 Transcript_101463/m.286222 type:complete len:225 (+) Transcript_101463:1235-1909(+)
MRARTSGSFPCAVASMRGVAPFQSLASKSARNSTNARAVSICPPLSCRKVPTCAGGVASAACASSGAGIACPSAMNTGEGMYVSDSPLATHINAVRPAWSRRSISDPMQTRARTRGARPCAAAIMMAVRPFGSSASMFAPISLITDDRTRSCLGTASLAALANPASYFASISSSTACKYSASSDRRATLSAMAPGCSQLIFRASGRMSHTITCWCHMRGALTRT